jgi:uncharacterized damage-inducible protein DinB
MKEIQRISKMFTDLYEGDPWIDVNLVDSLHKISGQQAIKKISPDHNSIWEILNHVIDWRENVSERIHGKALPSPENNYFAPITNPSDAEWQKAVNRLKSSQMKWKDLLENFKEEDLETTYAANGMSYYEHMHGILQHDAYHLGQINLLAKMVK